MSFCKITAVEGIIKIIDFYWKMQSGGLRRNPSGRRGVGRLGASAFGRVGDRDGACEFRAEAPWIHHLPYLQGLD